MIISCNVNEYTMLSSRDSIKLTIENVIKGAVANRHHFFFNPAQLLLYKRYDIIFYIFMYGIKLSFK